MYDFNYAPRSGCKDVFNAFLVENAEYAGIEEFPCIKTSSEIPRRINLFSRALKSKDYECWVVFYEHDAQFVRVWNQPRRYISILKRFKGVISPDFSLYRNMPLCMQKWSTYKGRALAYWWQKNGIEVIPNVRFADYRSYDFCFDGIEKNSTVAVGTHGCIKHHEDKEEFKNGLEELVSRLNPRTIIVYGATPDCIFKKYKSQGIDVIQFNSICAEIHSSSQEVV